MKMVLKRARQMAKEIIVQDEEQLNNLAERIGAIIAETRFNAQMALIEAKHLVGKEIVEDTLYQKGKWGSGVLIKEIAKRTGHSAADLYFCVQFYLKYPEVSNALETLEPDKKGLSWRDVIQALPEGQGEKERKHYITCIIDHDQKEILIRKKYESYKVRYN